MSDSDIFERVKKVIKGNMEVDESKIVPTASFVDDLGADSLTNVEVILEFENEFDIEIPEEQSSKIKTVADAVKFIEEEMKQGEAQESA